MHARVHDIDNPVRETVNDRCIRFGIVPKDEMRRPPKFDEQRIYRFGS
jgi:hypothetical protein